MITQILCCCTPCWISDTNHPFCSLADGISQAVHVKCQQANGLSAINQFHNKRDTSGALNLNFRIYLQAGFNKVCWTSTSLRVAGCCIKIVIDSMIQERYMHDDGQYVSKEETFWNEMTIILSCLIFIYIQSSILNYLQLSLNIKYGIVALDGKYHLKHSDWHQVLILAIICVLLCGLQSC